MIEFYLNFEWFYCQAHSWIPKVWRWSKEPSITLIPPSRFNVAALLTARLFVKISLSARFWKKCTTNSAATKVKTEKIYFRWKSPDPVAPFKVSWSCKQLLWKFLNLTENNGAYAKRNSKFSDLISEITAIEIQMIRIFRHFNFSF